MKNDCGVWPQFEDEDQNFGGWKKKEKLEWLERGFIEKETEWISTIDHSRETEGDPREEKRNILLYVFFCKFFFSNLFLFLFYVPRLG